MSTGVADAAARMIKEAYAEGEMALGSAEEATKRLFGIAHGEAAVYHGKPSKENKYWKRLSDGFIVIGPTVISDPFDYQRFFTLKKCRELPDAFGREQVGGFMSHGPTRFFLWHKNGGIAAVDETGEYGVRGAFLMPPEQMTQLLWHRDPTILNLRPDLAEGAVDVECPHGCADPNGEGGIRRFYGWGKEAAERSLRQHINAAHEPQQAAESIGRQNREMMAGMAELFAEKLASGGQQLDATQIVQMMAAAMLAVQSQTQATNTEVPLSNKYPEGEPDETWKRQELISYAAAHEIPRPDNPMKLKTSEWLQHVRAFA